MAVPFSPLARAALEQVEDELGSLVSEAPAYWPFGRVEVRRQRGDLTTAWSSSSVRVWSEGLHEGGADTAAAVLEHLAGVPHPNLETALCLLTEARDGVRVAGAAFSLDDGSLWAHMVRRAYQFSPMETCHVMRQVLQGVRRLHQLRGAHCDLTPRHPGLHGAGRQPARGCRRLRVR